MFIRVGSWEVGCGMIMWSGSGYNCPTSNTSYLRFSYKTFDIFIRVKSCTFQTHAWKSGVRLGV